METKPCRGCGKPVLFVKDEHGKTQVLDVRAPVYALSSFTEYEGQQAHTLGLDAVAQIHTVERDRTAFVSHFSTCPKANDFSASTKRELPGHACSSPQEP